MTREEAIQRLTDLQDGSGQTYEAIRLAIENLSAEPTELKQNFESVERKWITDRKPTEEGTYMVTVKGIGHHRFIDLMYYAKPIMPNRKVRGKCWYRSDAEWGDVVYGDEDILAWMPLPKPYGERREE